MPPLYQPEQLSDRPAYSISSSGKEAELGLSMRILNAVDYLFEFAVVNRFEWNVLGR